MMTGLNRHTSTTMLMIKDIYIVQYMYYVTYVLLPSLVNLHNFFLF